VIAVRASSKGPVSSSLSIVGVGKTPPSRVWSEGGGDNGVVGSERKKNSLRLAFVAREGAGSRSASLLLTGCMVPAAVDKCRPEYIT
jgi:hypothetical protein